MATKAQEWARERNMTGERLAGIVVNLRQIHSLKCLTRGEELLIKTAISKLETTCQMWKMPNTREASKRHYLEGR